MPRDVMDLYAATMPCGAGTPIEDAPGQCFGRLRLLGVDDAFMMRPRAYLLHGLLAEGELSVWWGPPKCGKSFLMLRLTYGLSLGLGMWGRAAVRTPIVYVAAEGQLGFGQRIRAIAEKMGHSSAFSWIGQSADLFDPHADTREIIAAARATGAKLVVLDTVSRVIPGADENSQRDMGLFVQNCDRIRMETGAHVALVHHGRPDAEWGRGSTVLPGAVDLAVRITGGPGLDEPRKAEVTHAKDDACGTAMPFCLRAADLPPVDGTPRLTCIAEEVGPDEMEKPRGRPLSETQRGWLNDLTATFAEPGMTVERVPVPGMRPWATLTREQVREGYRRRGRLGDVAGDAKLSPAQRNALYKMLNTLRDKGWIGMTDTLVWLL
ncbi:hypothetical protein EAH89_09515 [Roseomonas nepalensis]|uniref:AAA family ATPase n=1 Tax=Muricoccus nepalensis TaxID=1854500 RepID=A0A502GBV7_9PROT|nr:AAA family ATPase [Roseomonas nepalensis]TPG58183.1 hypothetical protein EAH89_09515 [Roseomonas nepalensis]